MPAFPSSLPAPRTLDPSQAPPLRWGVLGTGWIAGRFVRSVQRHTRQRFTAVASRDTTRAKDFAARHDIQRSYGSYSELLACADIDVVYVATEHTAHLPCARLALEAGKHTLIEKPIGLNAAQATEIAELAAERSLFCAEALWTFFLPRFDIVRQILDSGVLGEIRAVLADNGECFPEGHRILSPDMAGGPLLDLGTYPVSLASWVLGPPASVLAAGQPHPRGVNGQLTAILRDADGNQAVLHTTLWSGTPTTATIAGTRATLVLPGPFYQPGDVVLTPAGGGTSLIATEPRTAHDALYFEAAETARRIASGELENPLWPLASSITTLRTMDAIRARCGINFPGESLWTAGLTSSGPWSRSAPVRRITRTPKASNRTFSCTTASGCVPGRTWGRCGPNSPAPCSAVPASWS